MAFTPEPGERYTIRRKILVLFGASFEVYGANNSVVGYCRQKAFKLKEDIRICTDQEMTKELVRIQARSIIDFAATYDLRLADGTIIGSLRRKGFSSLVRDSWIVLDPAGNQIAALQEDSTGMALVRRFLPLGSVFFPSRYHLVGTNGTMFAEFRQHFNIFVYRLGIKVLVDDSQIDDLVVLATGCLIAAVEGRQDDGGVFIPGTE